MAKRINQNIMKRILIIVLFLASVSASAQTGLYIPSTRPIKNLPAVLASHPERFCCLIKFNNWSDTAFSLSDLDLLDSAYRIAFDENNPQLYTMMVEGYGNGDDTITNARVNAVVRYFAMRSHAPFPIRYAYNATQCSCHGELTEQVRFEVPLALSSYNADSLPASRKMLNKSIDLNNSVLITFHNNPDECLGLVRGCFVPKEDSTIHGYYVSLQLARGSVYAVSGTKDTCPTNLEITIDEHLNYKNIVERYFLVPHRKQIILQVGYVVLKSNIGRRPDECEQELPDSILLRIPATMEQIEGKLKFFAKKYTGKGIEYKAIPTRKVASKIAGNYHLQGAIDASQFDTIFLGKRIQKEELTDYFYEVDTPREQGSFTIDHKHYKAYRLDRHGEYELRKPLKALFRIVKEEDESITPAPQETDEEEIIDE